MNVTCLFQFVRRDVQPYRATPRRGSGKVGELSSYPIRPMRATRPDAAQREIDEHAVPGTCQVVEYPGMVNLAGD